jgi:L-seryl-tRNA(Ser) seleniumtransferase
MKVFESLKIPSVINAAGPVTRYGGSCLSERTISAMAEATGAYVRLDELQLAASQRLSEWTGAEAGYVTTGAAAGLTLGAAAIMAGYNVERMNQLPDTAGIPNEFVIQESQRGDYDHAIRSSGARLVAISCPEDSRLEEVVTAIDSARTDRTCGTVYVFRTSDRGVPLDVWVKVSHRLGLPVLVDASVRLPPVENLKKIPATGADLVAFSGGKALQGPQGSGFLVGRRDLIESALLQNQDLDVNAETWYLRDWIEKGRLERPPIHGIGRGFKVSKETLVGLLVALDEYLARDHAADQEIWEARIDFIVEGLRGIEGCEIEKVFDRNASYSVPMGVFRLTESARVSLVEFINRCASLPRPVLFEEGTLHKGYLIVHPVCLTDTDAHGLVESVKRILATARL